jgi:CubicO group peptidase (beta-lactamase class C family)
VVTGEPLEKLLKRRLFDPLGMKDTTFYLTEKQLPRLAKSYRRTNQGDLEATDIGFLNGKAPTSLDRFPAPNGGLFSTAPDYARFCQMVLRGGELDGKRYLSPAAFKDMTSDHIGPDSGVARDYFYFPGDGFGYGYGIAVRTDPGNAKPPPPGSIGELKWDSGSGTYFGIDPKLDLIYLMLEQTQNERSRITPAFKKIVYDAFAAD